MRDYANTIHRTRLIIVVVPVVMRPWPDARPTLAATGGVYVDALAAKGCMPLEDMMPGVAVKCCNATSCR